MSTDDLYYYRKPGEKTMGPEKLSVLIEYSNQGDLPMETQACKHGTGVWQFFSTVAKSAGEQELAEAPKTKKIPDANEDIQSDDHSPVVNALGIIGGIALALSAVACVMWFFSLADGRPKVLFFTASAGSLVSGVLFFTLREVLIRMKEISDSLKK